MIFNNFLWRYTAVLRLPIDVLQGKLVLHQTCSAMDHFMMANSAIIDPEPLTRRGMLPTKRGHSILPVI